MATALALALCAFAAARFVGWARLRPRALATFAVGCALACALYGAIDALAPRAPEAFPLAFKDAAGQTVAVTERRVPTPFAEPSGFLCGALALAALSLALRPKQGPSPPRPRRRIAWIVVACAAPYLVTLFGGLASPPRGYDALWYHLPAAVGFARHHHLEPPGRDLVFYFPANLELLAALAFQALGRRALALVQWPFAIASAAAAHALARAVGARKDAPLAAALVLASPIVLFQSQLAYTDLLGLFAVTSCALFLVRAARAPTISTGASRALAAGLCLGLVLGAKYAALPLALALALPAALWLAAPDGRIARPRLRTLALAGAAIAGALAPSWFWYARNLAATGNPIFPIAVPALSLRGLFQSAEFNRGKELEFVAARWQWLLYPWREGASHESGFGAGFAALLPAVGLAAAALVARVRRMRLPRFGLPLAWGAIYLGTWWAATPHEPRHLLPLVPLLGVPALAALPASAAGVRHAVRAGLLLSAVLSLRALCFSTAPELSARPRSYEALYGLPPEVTRAIPDGALVCNRARRPDNFALLGPRLTVRLWDFAPDAPSETDLHYHRIDYLLARGRAGELPPAPPWFRLVYDGPAVDQSGWEGHPDDRLRLYRLRAPAEK